MLIITFHLRRGNKFWIEFKMTFNLSSLVKEVH
jgi:hypothetical protein